MKKGHLVAMLGLLLLAFTWGSAQLYIGPNLQGGMTYSKNYIIKDTSQYFIGNSPSAFAAVGFDLGYQFDKHIRVQAGIQGQYRSFNLHAPKDATGLTFTNLKENALVLAIPVTLNYRVPLGDGGNHFFNIIAGHSLDYVKIDSLQNNYPITPVDSGNGFARHQWVVNGSGSPISSVLLGVGADMLSAKGNLFNISLVWGISTRQIFAGSVREWNTLHQDYAPSTTIKDPEEFPDHYYEWALRGSTLSLRASYYFKFKTKEEKEAAKSKNAGDMPEEGNKEDGKVEKPAKEKAEKPAKEEKAPKEKKSKEKEE